MRNIGIIFLGFGILFYSCNTNIQANKTNQETTDIVAGIDSNDVNEIKKLILDVLEWVDSEESFDLLPMIADDKDSLYIGFDRDILDKNLDILKQTDFFSDEFLNNYKQIILTLDRKLRNKEFESGDWLVGDLPIFKFANDINPWCLCQDTPSESDFDLDIINIDNKSGDLNFKWGPDSDWINFNFRVQKKDDKWRISYLQGFDYKNGVKDDGL